MSFYTYPCRSDSSLYNTQWILQQVILYKLIYKTQFIGPNKIMLLFIYKITYQISKLNIDTPIKLNSFKSLNDNKLIINYYLEFLFKGHTYLS